MLRFQLLISIALVTSVVISLITFYFTRTKVGRIQLPVEKMNAIYLMLLDRKMLRTDTQLMRKVSGQEYVERLKRRQHPANYVLILCN